MFRKLKNAFLMGLSAFFEELISPDIGDGQDFLAEWQEKADNESKHKVLSKQEARDLLAEGKEGRKEVDERLDKMEQLGDFEVRRNNPNKCN